MDPNFFEHNLIGAYTPVTAEGNIIVDEVLASCYAETSDHDLAHVVTAPIRWFPEITNWIFSENNGILGYVTVAEYLGRLVLPNGI